MVNCFLSIFLCVAACFLSVGVSGDAQYSPPNITIQRLNDQKPIMDASMSDFLYNYNTAWVPNARHGMEGLLVRVQNLTQDAKTRYDVGPSSIALSYSVDGIHFSPIFSPEDVVLSPDQEWYQRLGAEDPRVAFDEKTGTYYVFYTAVHNGTTPSVLGEIEAQLALAITKKIWSTDPADWELIGPIFPTLKWSKSGALIIRDEGPHVLYWGDSDVCIALSNDLRSFETTTQCPLSRRSDHFDSALVEAGPPPILLSDGNYLFLYNSAREGSYPNPKPGWNLEYNVGFAILDGKDPQNVLYRSEEPIFSPELDWEQCTGEKPFGLTPWVVFVEGWKKVGENTFWFYYGACDSFIGVAELKATFYPGV
eukprot:TRINITY_DN22606_c0_g1_i1.p1 TRINITY_DN22606_c0_g1~~TRINITY_DN22606_c0_g1_i1.p1  ORF type:complete len:366 (+),score=78.61 TRINITY_DN22606_c0_g1_i1:49-1146(+)